MVAISQDLALNRPHPATVTIFWDLANCHQPLATDISRSYGQVLQHPHLQPFLGCSYLSSTYSYEYQHVLGSSHPSSTSISQILGPSYLSSTNSYRHPSTPATTSPQHLAIISSPHPDQATTSPQHLAIISSPHPDPATTNSYFEVAWICLAVSVNVKFGTLKLHEIISFPDSNVGSSSTNGTLCTFIILQIIEVKDYGMYQMT